MEMKTNFWGVQGWHETPGKTPVEAKFTPEVSVIELKKGREISSADGRAHYRVAEDGSLRRLNKPQSKKAKRRASDHATRAARDAHVPPERTEAE